jgi:hypothetical protein
MYKIITEGTGRVLVKRRAQSRADKKQTQVYLTADLKSRIEAAIVGSQALGLEALIEYALDQLEKTKQDLEVCDDEKC